MSETLSHQPFDATPVGGQTETFSRSWLRTARGRAARIRRHMSVATESYAEGASHFMP